MTLDFTIDILGWSGACLLLVAYGLLSSRRLEGHSPSYQWMNIAGSACLLLNAGYHGAFPSTFVNLIWIVIAFWALVYHAKCRQSVSLDSEEVAGEPATAPPSQEDLAEVGVNL